MTTLIIEEDSPMAQEFIEYARNLPFATVIEEKKKSFKEASAECNAVTVDAFFDKLDARIKEKFEYA